jgi:hypothetical protein
MFLGKSCSGRYRKLIVRNCKKGQACNLAILALQLNNEPSIGVRWYLTVNSIPRPHAGVRVSDIQMPLCTSAFAEPPQPIVILQLYNAHGGNVICQESSSVQGARDLAQKAVVTGTRI